MSKSRDLDLISRSLLAALDLFTTAIPELDVVGLLLFSLGKLFLTVLCLELLFVKSGEGDLDSTVLLPDNLSESDLKTGFGLSAEFDLSSFELDRVVIFFNLGFCKLFLVCTLQFDNLAGEISTCLRFTAIRSLL